MPRTITVDAAVVQNVNDEQATRPASTDRSLLQDVRPAQRSKQTEHSTTHTPTSVMPWVGIARCTQTRA